MNRFSRISGRRKAVLAMLAVILLLMGAMRWFGIAGLSGTEARDMDWNGDGHVTRAEIAQAYSMVVVRETHEGARTCRSYAWVRDRDNPIRVDCRTQTSAVDVGD